MRKRSILVIIAMVTTAVLGTATPAGAQVPATCNDLAGTIFGTNASEVIRGTPGPDVIIAGAGNDKIFGGGGGDTICGGPGNDRIKGQQGNDYIIAGPGNDIVFGNAGGDIIFGLTGRDILWGGVGPDQIAGGPGDDTIKAGHGNDLAIGGDGNDVIEGSTGADGLFGDNGIDRLVGGKGFDELHGGDGGDLLITGPGDDTVFGDNGVNRCRVDQRDVFTNCNAGNVSGSWGNGFGSFRPQLDDRFKLDANGGPFYVMNLNAIPEAGGDRVRVIIRDANRDIILDAEFLDETLHNVLVIGEPSEVEILGAGDWSIAFVQERFPARNIGRFSGWSDEVFQIAPSPNGQGQATSVTVTNSGSFDTVVSFLSVGSIGLNTELEDTILAGETKTFTGPTRASANYIAVYANKNVTWVWELDSFQ